SRTARFWAFWMSRDRDITEPLGNVKGHRAFPGPPALVRARSSMDPRGGAWGTPHRLAPYDRLPRSAPLATAAARTTRGHGRRGYARCGAVCTPRRRPAS